MFGLINKAKNIGNKYAGNTDFLEALCAATALVVTADKDIQDSEVESAIETIKGHKTVAASFSNSQVERTFDTMLTRAKTLPGKLSLKREINDVATKGSHEMAEDVFATAVEVACADGDIGAEEQKILVDVAGRLGVNPRDFGL